MSDPVWLEVALNGGSGRGWQPNIPIEPQEIIEEGLACAEAGAAILHLHAYDNQQRPVEDAEIYARIIEGVRAHSDALVYPTVALTGAPEQRYAAINALGAQGLLEMAAVDPGSVNITHRDSVRRGQPGFVYSTPDADIRFGLQLAATQGWRPAFAIYEPGFARLGAAMAAAESGVRTPVYRVMFSDNLLFGLPPSPDNLAFYARHLAETAPGAPWMISGIDADLTAIIPQALAQGAHLRVGLEDAPMGSKASNLDLVRDALEQIAASGRPLATPSDVRAAA